MIRIYEPMANTVFEVRLIFSLALKSIRNHELTPNIPASS